MKRYALLVSLIACVLAASSGCCQLHSALCYPLGGCMAICDPTHCCDACGPACGVACGPACCDGCGPACGCGSACEPCAEPCGDVCADAYCGPCGGCGCPDGPLFWLYRIFSCGYCGSGCGECYWSEFHSAPPDCCDPCDQFGNFTGGGCYTGCGQCGGWGGCSAGCGGCGEGYGGGYCQSPTQPRGLLAGFASPNFHRPVRPATNLRSEGYVITDPSSRYAPRVVSVTERVVSPTPTKAAPVEQAAAGQVATQRPTTVPR